MKLVILALALVTAVPALADETLSSGTTKFDWDRYLRLYLVLGRRLSRAGAGEHSAIPQQPDVLTLAGRRPGEADPHQLPRAIAAWLGAFEPKFRNT